MKPKRSTIVSIIVLLGLGACDDGAGGMADTGSSTTGAGDPTGAEETADSGASYQPMFEASECSYSLPPEANVNCGFLTVPENRDEPEGAPVRLHVTIFESAAAQPDLDPIFILNGGPGASSLNVLALMLSPVGDLLRAHRPLVYIDQRGSNFSEPALYCTEPLAVDTSTDYAAYTAAYVARLQSCYETLSSGDARLSSYNTLENAADVEDLRIALGYDQVNLLGASYGTRLAMTFMRQYPDSVRSVVLDSVLPPNINPFHEGTASVRSALDALFAANPGTEALFEEVTESLREQAVTVTVEDAQGGSHEIVVDDLVFVDFVRNAVTQSPPDPNLVTAIEGAAAGALQAPAQARLSKLMEDTTGGPGTLMSADGMFASVFCADDGGRTTVAEAIAIDASHPETNPSVRDWAVGYQIVQNMSPCEFWDVEPIDDPAYYEPVVSDLPTMILAGAMDAQTPPAFATAASEGLGQSITFEMPTGHVTLATPCGAALTAEFIDDPDPVLESDCATLVDP